MMEIEKLPFMHRFQLMKAELAKTEIRKTGWNKFKGYEYFELSDILVPITELCAKYEILETFAYEKDDNGEWYPTLYVHDARGTSGDLIFKGLPGWSQPKTKVGEDLTNPIQNKGATITYDRRYLYLMAFSVVESDSVDGDKKQQRETVDESIGF